MRPRQVMLNKKNVLWYLRARGRATLLAIRFGLDLSYGCVYSRSAVERVLKSLLRDGSIIREDEWYIATGKD